MRKGQFTLMTSYPSPRDEEDGASGESGRLLGGADMMKGADLSKGRRTRRDGGTFAALADFTERTTPAPER